MAFSNVSDGDEKTIVLRHLMRRPELFAAAVDFVNDCGYFRDYPQYGILLAVLRDYWQTCRRLPGLDVYLHQVIDFVEAQGLPESNKNTLKYIVTRFYATEDFSDGFVEYVLRQERQDYEARRIANQIELRKSPDDILNVIKDAHQRLVVDPFRKLESSTAFKDIEGNMEDIVKFKLGLQFMDMALDGGLAIGETALLIAPSGGGKTTLGLQISDKQVREQMPVVYFHTEQPQKGDLAIRQYVLATNGTRAEFKEGYAKIPPDKLKA